MAKITDDSYRSIETKRSGMAVALRQNLKLLL